MLFQILRSMAQYTIFVILMLISGFSDAQISVKLTHFRDDYFPLLPQEAAFYKYHNYSMTWYQAKEWCEYEGATLFYPEREKEIKTVIEYLRIKGEFLVGVRRNDTGNMTTVDNTEFTLSFEESKEHEGPTCLFFNSTSYKMVSTECKGLKTFFVCKKTQASLQWNENCNMAVLRNDYVYNAKLKKCYKLHPTPGTWEEGEKICKAEQSYLAEVNSPEEATFLTETVSQVPDEEAGLLCLGFRLEKTGWKLLSGRYLRDSGYPLWAYTQPDGSGWEECGGMAHGRLYDIGCNSRCHFICEHDVKKNPSAGR